jgi:hypothetical protein
MKTSTNLSLLLASPTREDFEKAFFQSFVDEAKKRNPDVKSDKMLAQLARPVYLEEIKKVNAELEALKIVNRRAEK